MLNFFVIVAVLLSAVALLLGAVLLFKKYEWPMKYLLAIPIVVLLGFGVWWGISFLGSPASPVTPSSSGWSMQSWSPTPGNVWEFFKNYWLWIVLILAIPFSVLFAFKETWAKVVQGVVGTIAVVMAGAMIVHGIWGEAEKPKFSMSVYGESQHVKPPVGHALTITSGTGYTLHYVYADGRTGTFGDPSSPKGNGHITEVYVRDTSGKPNSVTYEFIRPN